MLKAEMSETKRAGQEDDEQDEKRDTEEADRCGSRAYTG